MTAQELADMDYPFGMPRAWVFTTEDEMLIDYEGRPIARYITDFNYTYDEESDDTCDITFQFADPVMFDLPYFNNDVVLVVQWGFVLPDGKVIKSPKRKVAIRDIESDYSEKGTEVKIKCSDLVAYLKGYKTGTIRKYSNPEAQAVINTVGKRADLFIDWLKEIGANEYVPTITIDKKTVRIDTKGGVTVSDYDRKTNTHRNTVRDQTAIPKQFYQEFNAAKTIKGRHVTIDRAVDLYLKSMDPTTGGGGTFITDSTDNKLDIRQRNFEQNIFKFFIWNGGKRNFTEFRSKTDTRKIEEDKVKSSGVNPFTKETDSTEVNVADTSEEIIITDHNGNQVSINPEEEPILNRWIRENGYPTTPGRKREPIPTIDPDVLKNLNGKTVIEPREANDLEGVTNETLEAWLDQAKDKFINNYMDGYNDQELPGDINYMKTINSKEERRRKGFYSRSPLDLPLQRMSVSATTAINSPEFQSIAEEYANNIKKKAIRAQELMGHAIEKIQRKYEASATVLGDPSLIKARTYGFLNLGKKNSGKWYATSVSHTISVGNGYMCEMELIRKPRTVGLQEINYTAKRNLLSEEERIELNQYISSKGQSLYSGLEDEVYEEMQENENPEEMKERVEVLNASDDFEDIDYNKSLLE